MNAQYYTTITSPALTVAEELVDIPSEHITGERGEWSRIRSRLTDVDFKLIFQAIRDAIKKDTRGDQDGQIYTVAYKIYDIRAVHHYEPITEMRYDVDFACYEEIQVGCRDSIEIVNVTDIDGRIWPGHLIRIRSYARQNNC